MFSFSYFSYFLNDAFKKKNDCVMFFQANDVKNANVHSIIEKITGIVIKYYNEVMVQSSVSLIRHMPIFISLFRLGFCKDCRMVDWNRNRNTYIIYGTYIYKLEPAWPTEAKLDWIWFQLVNRVLSHRYRFHKWYTCFCFGFSCMRQPGYRTVVYRVCWASILVFWNNSIRNTLSQRYLSSRTQ